MAEDGTGIDASASEASFSGATAEVKALTGASKAFGKAIAEAFTGGVAEGKRFSDVLRDLGSSLSQAGIKAATNALATSLSSGFKDLFSGLGSGLSGEAPAFARGGVFEGGRVTPFAEGGVVASPTYFPLGGGLGLAGEAGPEAILPLARGADGRLGVAGGGGATTVNVSITARDAESFRGSEAAIGAALARAVARGRRGA